MTIMSEKHYRRLFAHIPLREPQHLFRGYGGHCWPENSQLMLRTTVRKPSYLLLLPVRNETRCRSWVATWLAVIRPDWKSLFPRATAIHQAEVEQVANRAHWKERYPDVFREELGTVRGVNAKLHLKPEAVPKFCKPHPVPFALRSAMERELER